MGAIHEIQISRGRGLLGAFIPEGGIVKMLDCRDLTGLANLDEFLKGGIGIGIGIRIGIRINVNYDGFRQEFGFVPGV